jgi:bis(5'-adenosyl)-triphosphatase
MASNTAISLFGKHTIAASQIFLRSTWCFGLVNIKPIVPGHVLVVSNRNTPRYSDLTGEEISDLFSIVQKVGNMLQRHYKASSLTIVVQDGVDAGQTVPHVHVHVIPRRPNDFAFNDDVYDILEGRGPNKHRVDASASREPRSEEEMEEEANLFSDLLSS